MEQIRVYFPDLTSRQYAQLEQLMPLYTDWNSRINVISRKDIDQLYLRHVLHSLAIASLIRFVPGTTLLDVGTGGGFPGIPLAILFPECHFHLVDSIGKKIRVVQEVATAIGLQNITTAHSQAQAVKATFDFAISRAVMPLDDLAKIVRSKIGKEQRNLLPNGLICLKGGELDAELATYRKQVEVFDIAEFFGDPFFETKKIVYLPL